MPEDEFEPRLDSIDKASAFGLRFQNPPQQKRSTYKIGSSYPVLEDCSVFECLVARNARLQWLLYNLNTLAGKDKSGLSDELRHPINRVGSRQFDITQVHGRASACHNQEGITEIAEEAIARSLGEYERLVKVTVGRAGAIAGVAACHKIGRIERRFGQGSI
jgi:hypothetical protein